ncbi:hypothetical protein [Ornatilinea apprima]|uniref:hypothetical protein n=1 Tax=Ornatilinea apprima TaxID=1134406 RepID=UPI000946423F|nr:hypothetical protein [Ornatilinea apprima]
MNNIKIERKEQFFVALTALLALAITALPYLFAEKFAPESKVFMGIMLDVPDHAQYFSWMRDFQEQLLVENKLTPEVNAPVFFNLLWWSLGQLNSLFQFGYSGAIQILRIFGGLGFMAVSYYCASAYFTDPYKRKLSFLVISFGSGLGWIWVIDKYLNGLADIRFPFDVFIAEGNTFLGLLGYPHFLAAALYVSVFWFFMQAWKQKKLRFAVWGGLLGQFWGWQHAYDLWIIYAVMGAFFLLLWLRDNKFPFFLFKIILVVGFLSFPPGLYSFLLTALDPLWNRILAQFANAGVFTPSPPHLLILMGIPLILALLQVLVGRMYDLKGKSDLQLFVLGWFLISFVLIYLPVDYQIHMLNGWQIPVGILAVEFWVETMTLWLTNRLRVVNKKPFPRHQILMGVILILLVVPTNLYLLAWRFIDLQRFSYPYYLEKAEVDALKWLEQNSSGDDVVISSLTIGQYIPAWSGNKAFLAHWAQTVDYFEKEEFVRLFFQGNPLTPSQKEYLNSFSVDYVFLGPVEKSMGNFNVSAIPELQEVYRQGNVQIFQWREND